MKNPLRHLIPCFALTALSLSCTSESTDAPEASEPIRFATEIEWPTDRAVTDKTGFNSGDRIGVFAYYQSSGSPDFMNNQLMNTTDGTTWTYTPVKYWPNNTGATLGFYAYAPYTAGIAMSTAGSLTCHQTAPTTGTAGTFTSDTTPDPTGSYALDGNTDFLLAALPSQTKPGIGTSVTFTFRHALAKLTFKFSLGTGITSATVQSVAFTIPAQGTVRLDGTTVTWSGLSDTTGIYTRTATSEVSVTANDTSTTEFDTYVLPSVTALTVTGTVTPADTGTPTAYNQTVQLTGENTVTLSAGATTTLHLTLGTGS